MNLHQIITLYAALLNSEAVTDQAEGRLVVSGSQLASLGLGFTLLA